jgi:hypothetical protein
MRRLALMALALCLAVVGHVPTASAAFDFSAVDVAFRQEDGSMATRAGSHPFAMTTTLRVTTSTIPEGDSCGSPECETPQGETKNLTVELPTGFAGNPFATPRCSSEEFAELDLESFAPACPNTSAVGLVGVKGEYGPIPVGQDILNYSPVYNLEPPPGVAAKLGFYVLGVPVTVETGVAEEPPYSLRSTLTEISQALLFYGSELTLWGTPADSAHDSLRGNCLDSKGFGEIISLGECPVAIPKIPFLTLPRACQGPLTTRFVADSWQEPGVFAEGVAVTHDDGSPPNPQGMTACSKLTFEPQTQAQPTSNAAESPTGIDFSVEVDDEGLKSPQGTAQSDIRKLVVALPEGVTANPSAASGLGVCTKAQYEAADLDTPGCPSSAKLGTLSVQTPLLEDQILQGSVFLAEQDNPDTPQPGAENPFDSLLALYMLIRDPEFGIFVAQAVKVEPDPSTGRLVTVAEDLPQFPLSRIDLHLREGPRAPLVTPPACGRYATEAVLTPWSGNLPLTSTSAFEITSGPDGGPCPQGLPFSPGFQAGTENNNAGSHSPLHLRLTRSDGDQDLTKFSASLPPGLVAKLAGLSQCSDAALAAAKARTGRAEQAVPSCPDSARIGSVVAGAGVGEALTYVPGSMYLAGPYNGTPLSIAAIVPGVAGPFDVGTVVTRVALDIHPRTAEVTVDGAASDPIPHILAGIPLKVRDIRVAADRPQFTLNPTSCDPFAFGASIWGGGADAFSALDDSPVSVSERFQAANCAALGFKPRLSIKLTGGAKRGGHPGLVGSYRPRAGDANLAHLIVRMPRSAFLDQAHIRTICTRVQFADKACPKASIYGTATARTPLLSEPLKGPVYLRSSDNNLPDLVASLRGLIDVEAVARIDSAGGGIRATFTEIPDAPLTEVTLSMMGGKKGLIINSTNLCQTRSYADLRLRAHNAARRHDRVRVRAVDCRPGRQSRRKR